MWQIYKLSVAMNQTEIQLHTVHGTYVYIHSLPLLQYPHYYTAVVVAAVVSSMDYYCSAVHTVVVVIK